MKSTLALAATFLAATTTNATPITKRTTNTTCVFSPFESVNLQHGHDVNSGKIKLGGIIIDSGIVFGGSGCSPAWAVGGIITDATPTVYIGTAKPLSAEALAKLLGPLSGGSPGSGGELDLGSLIGGSMAGGKAPDLSGLLGVMGGGSATGGGDLSALLGALGGSY